MKVLVTGATGFLGSHVVPELLQRGHRVGALVREGSSSDRVLAECAVWTVTKDSGGVVEALTEFRPDVVVHLAALYICDHHQEDISPLIRTNIEFGGQLLEGMRAAGCDALVYAGSAWQHYRDQEYCPVNLYAATKQAFSALADYYRDAVGLRVVELHFYDSYGPNDSRPKLLNRLLQAAEAGTEVAMSPGNQRMHLVHVHDLSRGVAMACDQVRMLETGERRVYRLPSHKAITLRELVATVDAVDRSRPIKVKWGERPFRTREVLTPWEGAPVLPGWRPEVTLAEGLRTIKSAVSQAQ